MYIRSILEFVNNRMAACITKLGVISRSRSSSCQFIATNLITNES
jgi:hypothetical protein